MDVLRTLDRIAVCLGRALCVEGLDAPKDRVIVRAGVLLAIFAVVVRAVFWLCVDRYWEDALITCLHSENFVSGLGMTHVRPGEPPLHGFTSPLSVLVPLVGDLMHVGFGLSFIKIVSMPAAALTVLYLLGIGIHSSIRLPGPLLFAVMGYAAFEHHQILYGMAGMETQLAVLTIFMSMYYAVAWRPALLGVSLGLCMLARPDYCFWAAIVGAYALWKDYRQLPKIVGVALAVYMPWILFTTLYYGSPVPNTLVAKGLGYPKWWEQAAEIDFFAIKRHTWLMLAEHLMVMLSPTFVGHGAGIGKFYFSGPESPLGDFLFVCAVIGCVAAIARRQWAWMPAVLFAMVYSLYYVYAVPQVFHWYKMPYLIGMLFVSARGIQAISALIPTRARTATLAFAAAAYVALFVSVLPTTFRAESMIQRYIEDAVRKPAGLWFAEHMKDNEVVGCECLGYIGYYSRKNVYDWPGLNSRKVVEWSKANPGRRSLENMLHDLKPDYLFLRDMEYCHFFNDTSWIRESYHPVVVFKADEAAVKRIPFGDRNIDLCFRVFKKNRPEDPRPYDDSLWPCPEKPTARAVTPAASN